MASIPLPVTRATDQLTMRVENALEPILEACQAPAGQFDAATKNAVVKANLTLMNTALGIWVGALTTLIQPL
jgi:hypothetical protein